MVGHVTDAVTAVRLPLPGHQYPHSLDRDPCHAVCGDQDYGGSQHDTPAQEFQPGGDDDHLDQPGEGLGGGGQAGRVLLPPPDYPGAAGVKLAEP